MGGISLASRPADQVAVVRDLLESATYRAGARKKKYMAQQNREPLPRWHALAGGGLFNIALGSYYAWSVFIPALEKEFHWTRTQTSLVSTIEMVMLATMYNVASLVIGRFGARKIAIF